MKEGSSKIIKVISCLLNSYPNALTVESLNQSIPPEEFDIVLNFLKFFNVVEIENNSILVPSLLAFNFLSSLRIYIENDYSLISDWISINNDSEKDSFLKYGLQFLKAMERKRINYYGNKSILSEVDLIIVIIKAQLNNGKDGYLAQYNLKNSTYQLIGGYRKDKDNNKEIHRMITKELAFNNFEKNKYSFKQILENESIFNVSIKHGVYQRYNIDFFFIEFQDNIKLNTNDRWLTLDEISSGKTIDDIPITSLFTNLNELNSERIKKTFINLEYSLRDKQEAVLKVREKSEFNNDVESLIRSEESDILEFKSSIRWDYSQNKLNKDLEKVIIKVLSSFFNSNGGTLVIGVDDHKNVLGLERDMSTLKRKDIDGFQQLLVAIIDSSLGVEVMSMINISIVKIEDKYICLVKVKKSPKPIFLKDGEFYVRSGNTSKLLNSQQTMQYIQLNW